MTLGLLFSFCSISNTLDLSHKMALKALLGFALGVCLLSSLVNGVYDNHEEEGGMMETRGGMYRGEERTDKKQGEGKMMKKDEMHEGKEKMKEGMKMMKDGDKKGMMGRPMMCYSKKKKMSKGGEKLDAMSKALLDQASRLLGVVMMETKGSTDFDMKTLREVTEMLQKMIKGEKVMEKKEEDDHDDDHEKEEQENSELGMELLGIIENLIGEGQTISGVTVTVNEEPEEKMGGEHSEQPMHDTPAELNIPGLSGLLQNFDITSLGMDMKGLIDLVNDPAMSVVIEGMGLGPLVGILKDPTIAPLLENIDLNTVMGLLQSGKLFNAEGGVNLEAVLQLVQNVEEGDPTETRGEGELILGEETKKKETEHEGGESMEKKEGEDKMKKEEEEDDKKMMKEKKEMGKGKKTMKEMREGKEKAIMEAFDRIMALAGIEGEVDEENIMESTLKAMQFIMNADESTLDKLMESIKGVDLDIFAMLGEEMKGKDDKEGYEMICYPMSDKDMKEYKMMEEKDGMMKGQKREYMEKGEAMMVEKKEDMECKSCMKNMDEMKSMMKGMIQEEIGKVFNDLSSGMQDMSFVAPEIKIMLERMANGGMKENLEVEGKELEKEKEKAMGDDNKKETMEDKWGPWTEWDPCTQTCGSGVSVRSRTCNPGYMSGGDYADCEQSESRSCNVQPCMTQPPVSRNWGPWTDWSPCTAQCNGGTAFRARSCLDELPDCSDIASRMCNTQPCNAVVETLEEWLEWEQWGPCSATCGTGVATRRRQCVKKSGTASCQQVQTRACFISVCPTPPTAPFWQEWTRWTSCSVTCGTGISMRMRSCNDPTQENCRDVETRPCEMRLCTMQAMPVYGNWVEWSICTHRCGGGRRTRSRACLSGTCSEPLTMIEQCNTQQCTPMVTTQPPPVPTGSCPASRHRHLRLAGSCIVFHGRDSGKKSFMDYRNYCQSRGGDLVRMTDVDKWVQITYWLKSIVDNGYGDKTGKPWIGATDMGHRGMWTHPATPTQRVFSIWSLGEPKDAGYDQCAFLNVMNGHSYGEMCTTENYAVCEYRGYN